MRHANAVWAVDIEWLSFSVRTAASGRVSQMSETHEARKVGHAGTVLEDPGGHAIALALVEASASAATDDTSSILTTMLKEVQGIVYLDRGRLRLRIAVDHRNDTAHVDVIVRRVEVWRAPRALYPKGTRQLRQVIGRRGILVSEGSLRKSLCAHEGSQV